MRAVGYAHAPSASAPNVPTDVRERLGIHLPGAGLDVQRAAIAGACEAREWTLSEVFVDASDGEPSDRRSGYGLALAELAAGRADVLVAAKLDAVGPWSELPELLDRAEREGWAFLTLDFSLDTLSADGKSALEALGAQARRVPPSELPVPPAELMFRVAGSESRGRFELGGHLQLQELDRVLGAHGRSVADFSDILDFGCGPGRLLRPLRALAPQARLCGVDQDEEAIEWVRSELPFAEAAVAPALPPLPLPTDGFDLVIVYSVFTHFDEDYQDAWLAELERLTRPGGFVVATVHGLTKWEELRAGPLARERDPEQLTAEFDRRGFLHWRNDDWGAFFPDYYHTSFHDGDYIRDRWARWFEVVDIVTPQQSQLGHVIVSSGHDIVLLRARRGALARAGARLRRSTPARR